MLQTSLLLLVALYPQSDTATWHYPRLGPGTSGNVSAGGQVIGRSFSQETQDDFAKVLTWYAKRANCESVAKAYKGFQARKPTDAPAMSGSVDSVVVGNNDSKFKASAIYSFTDQHMHVTFLIPEPKRNRIVTISIASNRKHTTVNALMSGM